MTGLSRRTGAFLLLAALLALLDPCVASAAESGQTEAYLVLGGGGHYHVGGVDAGMRPAANLGAGVSFGWLAVEGSLSWTRLEWLEPPVTIFVHGGIGAISFEGDVLGLALQARLAPLGRGTVLRPYLTAGATGAYLDVRSDLGRSSSTWGLGVIAGGGVEVEILGGLSLDLGAMYSLTLFQDEVSWVSDVTESVLLVGTIRYYL